MTQGYTPTDNEIETAFHEYTSQTVKREKEWVRDDQPMSYPLELEDWRCGMAAYRRWLAAHDAQIRAEALTLTDEELDVAARAAFDSRDDAYDLEEWEDADSDDRERYQCYVRPAFSAVAEHRKEQKQ